MRAAAIPLFIADAVTPVAQTMPADGPESVAKDATHLAL